MILGQVLILMMKMTPSLIGRTLPSCDQDGRCPGISTKVHSLFMDNQSTTISNWSTQTPVVKNRRFEQHVVFLAPRQQFAQSPCFLFMKGYVCTRNVAGVSDQCHAGSNAHHDCRCSNSATAATRALTHLATMSLVHNSREPRHYLGPPTGAAGLQL